MSRNGFISDNLYDMRDRFKRNHEERLQSPAPSEESSPREEQEVLTLSKETPGSVAKTSVAEVAKEHSGVSSLPQLSSSRSNSDAAREARDLEGRLLRDRSFAEADAEYLQKYRASLEDFRSQVDSLLTELRALGKEHANSADYARRVDALRLKYFHAYGKFDAMRTNRSSSAGSSGSDVNVTLPSQWGIVAGIVAASLIVSLTLIFIFG